MPDSAKNLIYLFGQNSKETNNINFNSEIENLFFKIK